MATKVQSGFTRVVILLGLLLVPSVSLADRVTPTATTESVRIRSGASRTATVVGYLNSGEFLPLIATQGSWRRVRLATGEGFVASSYTRVVPDTAATAAVTVKRVSAASGVPSNRPTTGSFRLHLIDVGTGLSVLVQGADFTLLFDGGSRDDKSGISSGRSQSRLLAYLFAALGPSGRAECAETGSGSGSPEVVIDHVFLSHPHDDHGNMLDEVLRCYGVKNVWDSGRINDTVFYREFLDAVAVESGVVYHTAVTPPTNRELLVKSARIQMPSGDRWIAFGENDVVQLGSGAKLTILHADGEDHNDPNGNSTVVRLELGTTSVLLTGDAESGERKNPSDPAGDIEAELLAVHRDQIDVDILQVGHHGSMTSSRSAFISAVSPKMALIGSGPFKYGTVTLPDPVIVTSLKNAGAQVFSTKEHDGACPTADRVGADNERPGGCDNFVLEIGL